MNEMKKVIFMMVVMARQHLRRPAVKRLSEPALTQAILGK